MESRDAEASNLDAIHSSQHDWLFSTEILVPTSDYVACEEIVQFSNYHRYRPLQTLLCGV